MIADSVAFLVAQGKRVVYDAEHFFDGWRDDRDYALRVPAGRGRAPGAETVVLCDTNGGSLPAPDRRGDRRRRGGRGGGPRIGIHCHNDADCARGQHARGACEARRDPRPGHAQRLRRALRQREPRLDHPQPAAQAGLPRA